MPHPDILRYAQDDIEIIEIATPATDGLAMTSLPTKTE